MPVYKPRRTPRVERATLNKLDYAVRRWGDQDAPMVVLLHGWMDVSASWQFVVDSLAGDWQIVAPDLRGFGDSAWPAGDYYFPDYLVDLDALLDHVAGDAPVHLVGHSMGGNIAGLYAGIRPQRLRSFVSMEGFGLPPTKPEQAPKRYRDFLDARLNPSALSTYADFDALAAKLCKRNPRLSAEKAQFLARHWGREQDARVLLRGDPRHKHSNAVLYRLEEARACWQAITAPAMWLAGGASTFPNWLGSEHFAERLSWVPNCETAVVDDAGHMMHHDAPAAVAAALESFFNRSQA